MYYSRELKSRIDLNSWRYFNEQLNADRIKQISEQPPPSYKLAFQKAYNVKPIRPLEKVVTIKENKSFCYRFIDAFNHYCDTSSLHGLKYVGEQRLSKGERFFWLTAFLLAVAAAIYFISSLFINYSDSPVVVNYSPEMTYVQDIPFPAITVCNLNVAAKSRVEHYKKNGTLEEDMIIDDLCDTNTFNDATHIDSISWETMENTIMNVTQRCSEMIIGCKWQGKIRHCPELINSVITDDGYCCSFNKLPQEFVYRVNQTGARLTYPPNVVNWHPEVGYPDGTTDDTYPYRALGRGVQQGLTLAMDVGLDEYYCSTTGGVGFKMMFHTPREAPKIADLGFLLQAGVETRISVNVDIDGASELVRNIDYKKRRCFYGDEKYLEHYRVYNTKNCIQECEANFTLNKCGCTPFYLPRKEHTKICDKSDEECTEKAKYIIERYGKEKSACDCLPGCIALNYEPEMLSEASLETINNITYTEFLGNFTIDYFTKNVAVVHIFYRTERFQVQMKTAMYSFSEFVSNTGGVLGLFMGFSFLSAIEILYFLFIRVACVWCQNRRNRGTNKPRQHVFLD